MKKWVRSFKCIISFLVIVVVIINLKLTECYADEWVLPDYFEFIEHESNNSRLEQNGDFNFEFAWSLNSQEFYATSNTMTVTTQAYKAVYSNENRDGVISEDSSMRFTITLVDLTDKKTVGGYQGYCDGINGGLTFSVTKGHKYYLKINNPDCIQDNCTIKGTGHITNMSLNR